MVKGQTPMPAGGITATRALRILIVEDDAELAQMLETYLAAHGHAHRSVRTGSDAIAAASSWSPDVMLVDIGLPDMTGLDVARACKEQCCPAPLIWALTGRQAPESAGDALDRVLYKPVDGGRLEGLLAEVSPGRGRGR